MSGKSKLSRPPGDFHYVFAILRSFREAIPWYFDDCFNNIHSLCDFHANGKWWSRNSGTVHQSNTDWVEAPHNQQWGFLPSMPYFLPPRSLWGWGRQIYACSSKPNVVNIWAHREGWGYFSSGEWWTPHTEVRIYSKFWKRNLFLQARTVPNF